MRDITELSVSAAQDNFVAPNSVSLAEALFTPEAWYRAIYADGEPAGFVMLYDESLREETPEKPTVFLWRYMVDAKFQGIGVGKRALELVIDHVRAKGIFDYFELSFVPGEGSPEGFYAGFGFKRTGRQEGSELVMRLDL